MNESGEGDSSEERAAVLPFEIPFNVISSKAQTEDDNPYNNEDIKYILGDYVPLTLEFETRVNVKDPIVFVDLQLETENGEPNEDFILETVKDGDEVVKSLFRVYRIEGDVKTQISNDSIQIDDTDGLKIYISEEFTSGQIIRVEYMVKVSANNSNIAYGSLNKFYFNIKESWIQCKEDTGVYGKYEPYTIETSENPNEDFVTEIIVQDPNILQ
mgnify:CR=1 FL=1